MSKNVLDIPRNLNEEYSVLNSIHNLVLAVDSQGRIIVFNPACEKVFGISSENAMGKLVNDVIPGTGLLRVLKTGKALIGRKLAVNNSLYVVNRTPIIRDNNVVGAISVSQEITELQHLADELEIVKDLKGTLETIFESAQDGYITVNNDGIITMLNNTMADNMGVTMEQAIGRHITELVKDTELHLIPRTGKPQFGEVVRIGDREMVVMRYPIRKNGKITGAVSRVMFKDVNQVVALAEKINSLHKELAYYKTELEKVQGARYTVDNIIGTSPSIIRLKETIRRVAQGPSTVLVSGESGTGKELVAHAIHTSSSRRYNPFIKVNCAAIPESLLESELFGYHEGAFTGAKQGGQMGKFEQADGGTIFLDEIADMPLSMQSKLLRVLQEKEIERLGEGKPRKINVRVVAATSHNLENLIKEGRFRDDFYYRLNVVSLHIPPLRERLDDLVDLTQHYMEQFNTEFGLMVKDFSPEVWELFYHYSWPGNIREFVNIIERAFNLVEDDLIDVQHLPHYLHKHIKTTCRSISEKNLSTLMGQVEKDALLEALASTGGNKMQAAKILGISRAWLYKKIKQYNIKL